MNSNTLEDLFEKWSNDEIDGDEYRRLLREQDEREKNNEARLKAHRRYEIARDCMAGISTKFSTSNDKEAAEISVRWADALLAELEKSK